MNVLLLTSHSIAEYDDLRMLSDIGYNVFSIGAYTDPSSPSDDKRPALPDAPYYADLAERCERARAAHLDPPGDKIDWAKGDLHDDIIDWADVIIVHHFPEQWIVGQWHRIGHKRVIWRTCGQSDPRLEQTMRPLASDGLSIVRYSPAERRAFEGIGSFAGEDAVIRFGKYPTDYQPFDGDYPFWVGDWPVIGNITQHMKQRGSATGHDRWLAAVGQMLTKPAGPGSEELQGGMGALSYEEMLVYLRRIRCYIYTGTMPASYTLGLIEAMLSGVPVIPRGWSVGLDNIWLNQLWEADDIVGTPGHTDPLLYLEHHELARNDGVRGRKRAIELFDVATVGAQWVDFLGQP